MMTNEEMKAEFWMLTKGILQDSQVDTDEARVVKRWLEEHQVAQEFGRTIEKLDKFLVDGYIDRFESKSVIDSIGAVLATLRQRDNA